ncbi:MAG TPA: response regulator transcription factor [Fusibacter sp.]|nr:response regulator transcription factor [Fusibacter sp.]
MITILLAEDDTSLRKLMTYHLEQKGYNVLQAQDGDVAMHLLDKNHIDLMISDVMMPGKDGFTLTREIRDANYDFPVLMATALESLADKRLGFISGTDDYMVKPLDMEEMLLRVDALLRRAKIQTERKLVIGNTTFNYDALSVEKKGIIIELPKKEFFLLYKLLSYPKKIFTRQQLMDEIWGYDAEADERTVDVHIKRLREKFEDNDDFSIVTIRGLGYKAERNEMV